MILSCPSTSKQSISNSHHSFSKQALLAAAAFLLLTTACKTNTSPPRDPMDEILHGTIAYPFVDESQALGRNQADERFVIRSATGGTEYTIEIPGAARDYDVQVPLAEMGAVDATLPTSPEGKLANPVQTDKEMTAALPRLDHKHPTDTTVMDNAFGVGNAAGPRQAPSYTFGIARINDLYKRRQYEYALVELNNLLAFHPNSPKLHKMKGTVLVKIRNLPLAELAWIKALDLAPDDKALQRALEKLQKRIIASGGKAVGVPLSSPVGND